MLADVPIKEAYTSDLDDILNLFYLPVLCNTKKYDRLTGFFSSSALAIAAQGISELVKNSGKMRIIASPKFSQQDIDIMNEAEKNPEKIIAEVCTKGLDKPDSDFYRDHVFALGWMIARDYLQIKIAYVTNENGEIDFEQTNNLIFHQKVGICTDELGYKLTFSGSVNESYSGWTGHIEEFKTFRLWNDIEKKYAQSDIDKFNRFWADDSPKVKVIDLPQAVENKLVRQVPLDFSPTDLEKHYKKRVRLYDYQQKASDEWFSHGCCGLFEMATGTGKTFTSLGCLDSLLKTNNKLLTIIAVPYGHLISQWKREIEKFGIKKEKTITADKTNNNWRNELKDIIQDIYLGYIKHGIVLTTHTTFSSDRFKELIQNTKKDFKILLIADEVHGLGAKESRKGLISEYSFRLGLSATPKRFFDEIGTEIIYDYFNGTVFEFKLEDAITKINPATGSTYLTPYEYYPKFVNMERTELDEYISETKKIHNSYHFHSEEEKEEMLTILYSKRANIHKSCVQKYSMLNNILSELGDELSHTLIYCMPEQMDEVMAIVNSKGLIAHRFTMDEDTRPQKKYSNLSERDYLLHNFAKGEYQVLVAMKCLDMGVDVKPAKIAILMSSSSNPREYIQRIGRVIRHDEGKERAKIFDIIIAPDIDQLPGSIKDTEESIFEKELKRCEYIALNAINASTAMQQLYSKH